MKPIACITSLQHMRTLEQELKRDLDSHTFDHKNRKEKKISEHTQAIRYNESPMKACLNKYLLDCSDEIVNQMGEKRKEIRTPQENRNTFKLFVN